MTTLADQGAMINAFSYLREITQNNIRVIIEYHSPYYGEDWRVAFSKSKDGTHLSIEKNNESLAEAISEAYYAWRGQTATMPEHRLHILEHRPFSPSDPVEMPPEMLPNNEPEVVGIKPIPLGVYYVPDLGFFDTEGYTQGKPFYDKWNTRWAEFPKKTEREHIDIVNDRIPF